MRPYADTISYDDHEGYGARILPDGTQTATLTYQTRHFLAYQADATRRLTPAGRPRSTNGTTTTYNHSRTKRPRRSETGASCAM